MRDRFEGVVLGTAIGDALGYPVEFLDVLGIAKRYGPDGIQTLQMRRDERGQECALYSDDTQMLRATIEGLLRAGRAATLEQAAEEVAEEYIAWSRSPENNRSPGNACMLGCRALEAGVPWRDAGKLDGGGCGAAMRSMAYGLWWWFSTEQAELWAAEHALMTHRSPMAQASAAAVAAGVASVLQFQSRGELVGAMVGAASKYHQPTADMLIQAVSDAGDPEVTPDQVLDRWRGWRGDEAVAASLYCVLTTGTYRDAVVLAVNSSGDSDSLGAIAGALAGALYGTDAEFDEGVPLDLVQKIEKRDELLNLAGRFYTAAVDL